MICEMFSIVKAGFLLFFYHFFCIVSFIPVFLVLWLAPDKGFCDAVEVEFKKRMERYESKGIATEE